MRIQDVLRQKGDTVATVRPSATIAELLALLAEHRVGALVVSGEDEAMVGIVSERDVVRRLHERGPALLDEPVSAIMTTQVHTCGSRDLIDDLMRAMTEQRIRHIPVVDGGALVGIVSIGDIVKHRMNELETERRQLEDYIAG